MTKAKLMAVGLTVVLAALAAPGAQEVTRTGTLSFKTPNQLLIEHYQEEAIKERKAPEDFYLFERIASGGIATPGAFRSAAREARAVERETRAAAPRLARRRWRSMGPTNIGARVVDVVTDVKRRDVVYTAAASGGVWKSRDRGMTWKPIWSKRRTQAMGALAMGSNGTLWAGTGETNPGGGSLTYGGNGVWRSTNRGKTWKNMGLRRSSRIGRVVVHPNNPRRVLVAVTGSLFKPGGMRGLYETRNNGRTWKRILRPPNDTTGAADVAIDPHNPKHILVGMWDHLRYPDYRRYTGPGSGVYRSTNGGKDFTRLDPVNAPASGLPLSTEVNGGRVGVAFDSSKTTQRAYAIYANNNEGSFAHWFISTNNGANWVAPPQAQANLAASQSVYGWWFGKIFVDPTDPNHVFVSGLHLYASRDGGLTFPSVQTQQHVDHHGMAWDPYKLTRVYNGNDGGVYRSEQDGDSGTWKLAKVQPWNQFFQIDVSEQDPRRVNGGTQDNGSWKTWDMSGRTRGKAGWTFYYGGDGVENVINPKDKKNVFACSQYGACGRSDNGGNSMEDMANTSVRNGWLTPIHFKPGSGRVMYWGADRLHKSTDRGRSWEPISPDLGEGEAGRETNPLYAGHYGTIQAIGLNKKKPKVIYAGTDNGRLWKTTNGGGDWRKLKHPRPNRWITNIQVKMNNPGVLYLTYSGYRNGDNTPYVFRSRNGGKRWKNITKNLPKAPVNDAELLKNGRKIYVATDVGVFVTKTKGRVRWRKVGRGLPLVPVNDIKYHRRSRTLTAGTFGRGIWRIRL